MINALLSLCRRKKCGGANKKIERQFMTECNKVLRKSTTCKKTNENSRTALRSFLSFTGRADIPVSSITAALMERYEQWLRERGVSANTSAAYMRSLRALYNKITGCRHRGRHPFAGVRTAGVSTSKRAISIEDLHRVAKLKVDDKKLQLSRDLFLFSFYCMGMPFIDIAHLRKRQIQGDTLTFRRQKTDVEVVMHLEPEARAIIERYTNPDSEYVFPILSDGGDDSNGAYRRALSRHNRHLQHLEQQLSLSTHLSSYVPRHTWATLAYNESGDLQLVSAAIGHTNTKITHTYIKPLSGGKTAALNRKLISLVGSCTYRE